MPTIQKCFLAALCLSLSVGFTPTAAAQSFQENVNRPGHTYLTLSVEGAHRCQKECIDDGRCRAWVFIGTTRVENCRLMSQRPAAVHDQCCYSGVVAQ